MKALFVASTSLVIITPLLAEDIDGLYQPSGTDWTCSLSEVGMDGGALAIQNGVFEGIENRCTLTNPQPNGRGTQFAALCSAEGNTYEQPITITPTANGVSIQRDGVTSYWRRCEGAQTASTDADVPQGRWSYSDRAASIIAGGNAFELSCEAFNPSSTYPTARLVAPCPVCFPMETSTYTLRVDGQLSQDYTFERVSNAEGSISDLDYYPLWNEGLIIALMAGSVLEVIEQGNVIATFPLVGSSRAIGQLRQQCN